MRYNDLGIDSVKVRVEEESSQNEVNTHQMENVGFMVLRKNAFKRQHCEMPVEPEPVPEVQPVPEGVPVPEPNVEPEPQPELPPQPTLELRAEKGQMEFGDIRINHEVYTVVLEHTYVNPVVIMGTLSFNGGHPSTVRVFDVTENSFKVMI